MEMNTPNMWLGSHLWSNQERPINIRKDEEHQSLSSSSSEVAVTDLTELLFQPAELLDEAQLLGPAVGQSHQAVEQLVYLVIQSGHPLHCHPLLFYRIHTAEPRQGGSALLLQLHQSAVF